MPDDDEPLLVSAAPQRKLAVILAADVAGYSRLMERDEEDTHERLQRLLRDVVRPAVKTHQGRIFKTAGDGFLAEFASAIEAVRCAVDIQRAAAEQNEIVGWLSAWASTLAAGFFTSLVRNITVRRSSTRYAGNDGFVLRRRRAKPDGGRPIRRS